MTQAFHKFWLKISAVTIASFGPVAFLATMPEYSEAARFSLDVLHWPVDGQQTYEGPTMHFMSALLGGFLFGWGIMVWCLSVWVHDLAPEGVRKSVLTGALAWFLLDSAGSYASGAWPNVIWNIFVLLLIVGPMWRPARG